jgi:hypothetical protein
MSDIDADHDQPRSRHAMVAVILAVVFLAILGSSVGYLLGSDKRDQGNKVAGDQTTSPTDPPTGGPSPGETATDPGGNNNGGGNTRTRTANPTKSYPPARRDACPQQTAEAVGAGGSGDLNLVLYVRTARSEAWICQYQGRTVYQGHVRGRSFPGATSDNSILVTNVRYEAGVHAATNGNTVYYVSVERLRIERNGKEEANEAVEDYYGG